jgi:hypothetical protein
MRHIIARQASIFLYDSTIASHGFLLVQMTGHLKQVSLAVPVVRKYHLRFRRRARTFSATGMFLDKGRELNKRWMLRPGEKRMEGQGVARRSAGRLGLGVVANAAYAPAGTHY